MWVAPELLFMSIGSSKNSKFWELSGLVSLGMWSINVLWKSALVLLSEKRKVKFTPDLFWTILLGVFGKSPLFHIVSLSVISLILTTCYQHLCCERTQSCFCSNQSTKTCVWWSRAFTLHLYIREVNAKWANTIWFLNSTAECFTNIWSETDG